MPRNASMRKVFADLVAAHEEYDEDAVGRLSNRLRTSGSPLRVVVEEATAWEESMVEGYAEFPVVTQTFKVFAGDELLYEGERQFGASLEDPTHTGAAAKWSTIRIDNEEHAAAEAALEELGLEFGWPSAPPAR